MRILGIDPGYDRLGIAVIEKPAKGRESVLFSNCFQTSAKKTFYQRLAEIGEEIGRLMDEFQPSALALETLFITKNQKTAMRVAEARGVIIYEAAKRKIPTYEYSPPQIKSAVTSDGNSDKQRIIKMIKMLVKLPDNKKLDDEYDAIAVALTHSALIHNPALLQK